MPGFHLQITAADGVLPEDTALSMVHEGILTEHYSLAKGGPGNIDLCCAPGQAVKGPLPSVRCGGAPVRDASVPLSHDGAAAIPPSDAEVAARMDASAPHDGSVPSGPTAIHCSIWTDNVADVTITATGYATYEREFEAYVRDPRCGVETIDARVTLYHREAGM